MRQGKETGGEAELDGRAHFHKLERSSAWNMGVGNFPPTYERLDDSDIKTDMYATLGDQDPKDEGFV